MEFVVHHDYSMSINQVLLNTSEVIVCLKLREGL